MRITSLTPTLVNVPFATWETLNSGYRKGASVTLVEVETDEGVSGIGEALGNPHPDVVETAIRSSSHLVVGEDPFRIEALRARFMGQGRWHSFATVGNGAWAGIEMALWDIVGKVAQLPVHKLLGGAVHDEINLMFYLQRQEPEKMLSDVRGAIERGYTVIYVKVGADLAEDRRNVRELAREIAGRAKLRIDANEAWSVGDATVFLQELHRDGVTIDWVEQPTLDRDVGGLRDVRMRSPYRIAANQGSWTEYDALEHVRARTCDVLCTDLYQVGGILMFKKVCGLCELAGIPVNRHSWPELGVGLAAAHQVLATVPHLPAGHQNVVNLLEDDILEGGRPALSGGNLAVPQGPGLGVTLDPARVKHYADHYRHHGPYLSEDTRLAGGRLR